MIIVYNTQIKAYFVVDKQGNKVFRSWTHGVCQDYINDNQGNKMTLITKHKGYEVWAQFDQAAQVYELFYDNNGESYTGWRVDSIKDAHAIAKNIILEHIG